MTLHTDHYKPMTIKGIQNSNREKKYQVQRDGDKTNTFARSLAKLKTMEEYL